MRASTVGFAIFQPLQHVQHGAVGDGVEELRGVPARGQRTGLGLAVADDADRGEVRVVEHGPKRVHQRIAQLTALVDRARRLRRDMAGDAPGEGELPEKRAQPVLVGPDRRVDLAVVPSR